MRPESGPEYLPQSQDEEGTDDDEEGHHNTGRRRVAGRGEDDNAKTTPWGTGLSAPDASTDVPMEDADGPRTTRRSRRWRPSTTPWRTTPGHGRQQATPPGHGRHASPGDGAQHGAGWPAATQTTPWWTITSSPDDAMGGAMDGAMDVAMDDAPV